MDFLEDTMDKIEVIRYTLRKFLPEETYQTDMMVTESSGVSFTVKDLANQLDALALRIKGQANRSNHRRKMERV